jgi:putative transposase
MHPPGKVYRTYRYRIYPTKGQRAALAAHLRFACDLYNAALEQRREAWKAKRPMAYATQCRELAQICAAGDGPSGMSYSAMRDPLWRIERSFQNFIRRSQAGQKPGLPRFRSWRRYNVLSWGGCWAVKNRRLSLPGIGHVKVKWHRQLPTARTLCTVTVRRHADRWYACIVLAMPMASRPRTADKPAVGVDLGIQNFAALSTGKIIAGPRAYRSAAKDLRRAQRRVSRRVRGSMRRQKASLSVARLHERIRNLRMNHAHQLSRQLVAEFGLIAVENLLIRDMGRGSFAKDARDQGWAQFLRLLGYKAEEAGVRVVPVPPAGTTRRCSECGSSVPKPLSERSHKCADCGLVLDRDVNAARNILRLGMSRQATTWPTGACVA